MADLSLLAPASSQFERCLAAVGPDAWAEPTPCDGWDVTELVLHVVGGNAMCAAIVGGASSEEGMEAFTSVSLGEDPLRAFRSTAAAQADALQEPGALDTVVHHPMGDLPATQLLQFRMTDLLVHAWDLARATGNEEDLDPAVVEAVWEDMTPLVPMLGDLGIFGSGPSGAVGSDQPRQLQLLDALGRRP